MTSVSDSKRQKGAEPFETATVFLKDEVQAWCGSNGLVMVAADRTDGSWQHAPVAMTPASFPRKLFQQALELATPFNTLVEAISRDDTFLSEALRETAKADEFTGRLLRMYEVCGGSKSRQKLQLAIHRSDYMVDEVSGRLLQIELNTISSSFGCLSARVSRLHRFLISNNPSVRAAVETVDPKCSKISLQNLPENRADSELPHALELAHRLYCEQRGIQPSEAYVVFVVQERERNYVDQRHIHYELQRLGVPCLRRTLGDIRRQCKVDEAKKGALILEGNIEVSVAYFRSGYTPNDYPEELQWEARELIEQSLAVKCPSLAYHLAGAKKIQQKLAEPDLLNRFVKSDDERAKLKACFAGLWSLGQDLDETVRKDAMAHPNKYVMKPQREGGGNNLYGEAVKHALETMKRSELSAYILMERIFPPRENAFLMRNGEIHQGVALSELGIYSTFLGDGERVYLNKSAGHLLRTKFDGVDEGGVASGFAFLNSPSLSD